MSHTEFVLFHVLSQVFGTMPAVWQQIQGGHAKAASIPCCGAANHIAARQLSYWVVVLTDRN